MLSNLGFCAFNFFDELSHGLEARARSNVAKLRGLDTTLILFKVLLKFFIGSKAFLRQYERKMKKATKTRKEANVPESHLCFFVAQGEHMWQAPDAKKELWMRDPCTAVCNLVSGLACMSSDISM